jgi:hypothetical protein
MAPLFSVQVENPIRAIGDLLSVCFEKALLEMPILIIELYTGKRGLFNVWSTANSWSLPSLMSGNFSYFWPR